MIMNNVKSILWMTAVSVALFGCGNGTSGNSGDDHQAHAHDEHHHDDHHYHESSDPLELDNGDRWVVNEEMKPYVAQGEALVDEFINDDKQDYRVLAEDVKEQNTQLILSCTMTGKSHDELHKWLHPHLELVDRLEKTTDEREAKNLVAQLQTSYEVYHQHFQ